MALTIVGTMTSRGIVVKDKPEHRKPQLGDIAECGGRYWLVTNPEGTGNQDITEAFTRVSVMADLTEARDYQQTVDAVARENA